MSTGEMLPVLDAIDQTGYKSLEVWGGATFDSCIRFLGEDPWERLRTIRKKVTQTELQMLLRGQNIVGYKNYADDILELFVKKALENGLDRIRTFDALNDLRNLEKSIEYTHKFGGHIQVGICYTTSPFHQLEYYSNLVDEILKHEPDSICIKDMAGLLTPKISYDLVKLIKGKKNLPVEMHTHCTVGTGELSYLAAFEAGAELFDTATSSLSGASSQPAVESFYFSFKEYPEVSVHLNSTKFLEISDYFEEVRKNHEHDDVNIKHINLRVLSSQVPGGMLSNLFSQLKKQNAMNRLNEVMDEIPLVRKELGYPPLVTPTSQIVGVQAVLNVLTGKRYSRITKETEQYVKGHYGKPPAPIDPDLKKQIVKNPSDLIDCRPADLIAPQLPELRKMLGSFIEKDEDLLSIALFGDLALNFLKSKYFGRIGVDETLADMFENGIYPAV
jgi:oxaloacetate decarboxylase alpha subunit